MSSNIRYIDEPRHQARPISATVNEVKEEVKQFAETRIAMLQAEMREKVATIKASAPMLVAGGIFAYGAFLAITGALIALVWTAFAGSRFGPFLAFLIVAVFYAIIGGALLSIGLGKLKGQRLMPERTIKVLKEDKVWIQNEARNQP